MAMNDYKQMTDNDLVLLAQDGDNGAMEELIGKYKNFVKSKSRTYFLIGADRDDIIQEGMLGLFKAIRDYKADKQASFRSFAELCVTRQMITAVKTATRQKHTPLNNYISLNKPVYEDETERTLIDHLSMRHNSDPEVILIDNENYTVTNEKIKSMLSRFEYEVLEKYINGQSYNEIAVIMDKSPKSIDNALQRIKKKVLKCLEEMKGKGV
ncbi:MAG: RNA polymerase sporulation sigma factor SigH [Clostridia bacterium]|nr:RNA polymerase sporulation sigma factor SigH [Clostridia bacterium]